MSVRPKKEKKQSKSPAGMTEKELKDFKKKKELKDLKKKLLKAKYDDMSMPPDRRSKEQKLKKGQTKKGIGPAGGAPVNEKTGKVFTGKKIATTKGWGASKKT